MARTAPVPNIPAPPGMNPGAFVAGGGGDGGGAGGKGGKGGDGKEGAGDSDGDEDASGGEEGADGCGDPVCPISGKVFFEYFDFGYGAPHPLAWTRHYSSRAANIQGELGFGWSHPYGWKIREERRTLSVFDHRAREQRFKKPKPGSTGQNRLGWRLDSVGDSFELQLPSGVVLRFRRTSPKLHHLQSVSDSNGNTNQLERDASGFLKAMVDSAGRRYRVGTDEKGRITLIEVALDAQASSWMVAARYAYDKAGDLRSYTDAEGHLWRYAYEKHLLTAHTTALDLTFHYVYDGLTPAARCIETWGDYPNGKDPALEVLTRNGDSKSPLKGIFHMRFNYSPDDRYTEVEDGEGGLTRYFGDSANRVIRRIDPDGGVTERSFHTEFGGLAEQTRPNGYTVRNRHSEDGVPLGYEGDLGGVEYEPFGDFDEVITDTVNGTLVHRQYDARGNLVFVEHADGTTQHYEIDGRGLLSAVTDRAGERTTYDHDAMGNCIRVVSPHGQVEHYEYHYLGWCLSHVDPGGQRTDWRYNRLGDIVYKRHADGSEIHITRDAERCPTHVIDQGRSYRFEWGGVRWCTRQISPSGRITEHKYDSLGRRISIRNGRGQEFRMKLDPAGRCVDLTTFEGLRQRTAYDLSGLAASIETDEGFTTFERDGLNRVTLVEAPDGTVIEFERPSNGPNVIDNGIVRLERIVDDEDRIRQEKQGPHTAVVAWGASSPERIRTDIAPNLEFKHTARGEIREIEFGALRLRLDIAVQTQTGVEWLTELGDSLILRRRYSRVGQLEFQAIARRVPGISQDQIATYSDPNLLLWRRYEYHADHMLRADQRSDGDSIEYTANVDGLVERRTVMRNGNIIVSEDIRYDGAGSPILDGVRFDALHRPTGFRGETFEYDVCGRLSRRITDAGVWEYEWGALDTLIRVTRPDHSRVEYDYDAFGRRCAKRVIDRANTLVKSLIYFWSNNTVLHERDLLGEVTRTYLRETDAWVPLAVVDRPADQPDGSSGGAPRVLFVVRDPSGGFDCAIDERGNIVESGMRTTYGDWAPNPQNSVALGIRYANQFYDEDCELTYNLKRWYDARVGYFVSPDPTLLSGTLNPRDYASNPLVFADPTGLTPTGGVNGPAPGHGHPTRPSHPAGGNPDNYDANYLSHPGYNATNGTPAVPGYASADPNDPTSRSFGSPNDPTSARSIVDAAGEAYGCHSCGRTKADIKADGEGTFNHWIPDHQPPVCQMKAYKENHPKKQYPKGQCRLYPHCPRCSSRQKTVLSSASAASRKSTKARKAFGAAAAKQMKKNAKNSKKYPR